MGETRDYLGNMIGAGDIVVFMAAKELGCCTAYFKGTIMSIIKGAVEIKAHEDQGLPRRDYTTRPEYVIKIGEKV